MLTDCIERPALFLGAKMVRLKYFVAACLLTLTVGSAEAVTYDVVGADGAGATLTGTIIADSALANFTAINLVVSSASSPYTDILAYSGNGYLNAGNGLDPVISIDFVTPLSVIVQDLQATYQGGVATIDSSFDPSLCGGDAACVVQVTAERNVGLNQALSDLNTGLNTRFAATATPEVSAAPLPAALPLFASGLGGMGLFGWWRKRKDKLKNAATPAAA